MRTRIQGLLSVLGALAALACNFAFTVVPTPIPPTPTASPQPTDSPSLEEWQTLQEGLQLRVYVPDENTLGQILVLRINPLLFTFRVHYRPGESLSTSEWRNELPHAVAFVNANFFDRQHQILGLLVADGAVYGTSYTDRGGRFAVQDGLPIIRSNIETPYQGEVLEQAVQAFPMLVFDGAQAYTTLQGDRPTRRTVVAQDRQGNILLIATPLLGMRLADLAAYLLETDLELVHALNLDGGGSTMMVVQTTDPYVVSSFDGVPAVLAIYSE